MDMTDFFSATPLKEENSEPPQETNEEAQESSSSSWWGTSGWSILNTVKEQSQSLINIYKEEISEFTKVIQHDTAEMTKQAVTKIQDTLIISTENEEKSNLTSTPTKSQVSTKASKDNIVLTRFQANLLSLQSDIATYCNEPVHQDEFQQWKEKFALNELTDEITSLLAYNEKVRALHSKLVPKVVSYSDFWTRYYYKVYKLEQQEKRRVDLLKRAQEKFPPEEEEFSWGDDEEGAEGEKEEKSGQRTAKSDSTKQKSGQRAEHDQTTPAQEPEEPNQDGHNVPNDVQLEEKIDQAPKTEDQKQNPSLAVPQETQQNVHRSLQEVITPTHADSEKDLSDASASQSQDTGDIQIPPSSSHEQNQHSEVTAEVAAKSENTDGVPSVNSTDPSSSTEIPASVPIETPTNTTSTTTEAGNEDWAEWE